MIDTILPSIDERLAAMNFPAPLIRQMNQAAHKDAIKLWLWELGKGFDLAPEILQKIEEINIQIRGWNKSLFDYGPNAGDPELRNAVAQQQGIKDGKEYNSSNTLITIWVQNAMQTALGTLNRLGAKRVLIPSINFWIYKKIPSDFWMEVVHYNLTPDYGIDLQHLSDTVQKDDIIILNPVANPTGRVLSSQELEELAILLQEKLPRWYVISDEIYDSLVYGDTETSSFSRFFDRTITCNGISKSGAMAGLRVGWVVSSDTKLIEAMSSFNTSQISSPAPLNQKLALPVVNWETQASIDWYNQVLLANRERALQVLWSMWLNTQIPQGSFYIFPQITDTIADVKQACLQAAKHPEGVVVIPWQAFWAERNVRISLATGTQRFAVWMDRFQKLFS